jgi:hypothetical protein
MAKRWAALKAACRKQHKGGPGGAAMCVCGANGGGSDACGTLGIIKSLILYMPTDLLPAEWQKRIADLRDAIH